MTKLVDDVSVLTNIPEAILEKLVRAEGMSIGHAVYEAQINKKSICEIDIGIGTLFINIEPDALRYRFVPSAAVEKAVRDAALGKSSPLKKELDNNLSEKLKNSYRDLL